MKKIFIALLGIAIVMPSVFAATWHISPNGNDINDGSSWALAKQTIQSASGQANAGDTVLVTNGTYVLTYSVTIFNGLTVKSVNGAGVTLINGNYPVTAIRCFDLRDSNAILDGFTIIGGYTADNSGGGAGIINRGTVKNCIIWGNIEANDTHQGGGGIYNLGTLQDCIISGNTASMWGGGVYNKGIMQNCTVSWNSVPGNGPSGGVVNDGTIQNCIIYYNGNGEQVIGANVPQYSCAPGLSGNGNISSAPQFEDSANGDYRLKSTSPCINAGINQDWMANAVDLDGNPRISYGRVDMGAYEFAIKNSTNICPVIKANGQTDNVLVNHPGNLTITVQIDPGQYQGAPVNWWVVTLAGPSWYYLNDSYQWTQFDGNLSNCHPVYQGALFNLPATKVLNMTGLPVGSYTFWFVVNYPMNGILNISEPVLVDWVNVTVQ